MFLKGTVTQINSFVLKKVKQEGHPKAPFLQKKAN